MRCLEGMWRVGFASSIGAILVCDVCSVVYCFFIFLRFLRHYVSSFHSSPFQVPVDKVLGVVASYLYCVFLWCVFISSYYVLPMTAFANMVYYMTDIIYVWKLLSSGLCRSWPIASVTFLSGVLDGGVCCSSLTISCWSSLLLRTNAAWTRKIVLCILFKSMVTMCNVF